MRGREGGSRAGQQKARNAGGTGSEPKTRTSRESRRARSPDGESNLSRYRQMGEETEMERRQKREKSTECGRNRQRTEDPENHESRRARTSLMENGVEQKLRDKEKKQQAQQEKQWSTGQEERLRDDQLKNGESKGRRRECRCLIIKGKYATEVRARGLFVTRPLMHVAGASSIREIIVKHEEASSSTEAAVHWSQWAGSCE